MELDEFLAAMGRGEPVTGNSDGHEWMHRLADRAQRLTAKLNNAYHTPEEIRQNIADLKGSDFDQWMQRFCQRKYQADFSLEMSRSVAAALKEFQG